MTPRLILALLLAGTVQPTLAQGADPCGQIGETVDLDEAVQEALAFVEADGHTLVIVTSDMPIPARSSATARARPVLPPRSPRARAA